MSFSTEDIQEATKYESLGPAYFAARRVSEAVMAGFEAEMFKPMIEKFSKELGDEFWQKVETFLLSDTESNIQGHVYRMVDASVDALLSGEKWALDRYVLKDSYDREKIRSAIFLHAGKELRDQTVVDLQKKIDDLEKDLSYYRNRG